MNKSRMLLLAMLLVPGAAYGQTDMQKTFTALKGLSGSWTATFATMPAMPGMDTFPKMRVTLRVTSRGNAIVHEMQGVGKPDDYKKYDHPLTMIYLNDALLTLTHYCDAGNRPRMLATASPDGKTVDFEFADIAGPTTYGHMHHAKFTFIDADHHTEQWTYMLPNGKSVTANFALEREPAATASSNK